MNEDEDSRKRNESFTIKAGELYCEELYSFLVFAINTYRKAQKQFLWKVTSILRFSFLGIRSRSWIQIYTSAEYSHLNWNTL